MLIGVPTLKQLEAIVLIDAHLFTKELRGDDYNYFVSLASFLSLFLA